MEIKLAHLHITTVDSNGQSIDTVYIIEDLNITHTKNTMPVYEIGKPGPTHFVAGGATKTTFQGTGYLFHQGPTDPKKTLVPPEKEKPFKLPKLETEADFEMEHLDYIDIE